MLATWIQSKKDEDGFTLIELLVVVIIIGILAAIAIPVFLNQRENAWRSAGESDARNAAIQIESAVTQTGGTLPDGATATAETVVLEAGTDEVGTMTASENVTLVYAPVGQTYTITVTHALLEDGEDTLVYNSAEGGLANAEWG